MTVSCIADDEDGEDDEDEDDGADYYPLVVTTDAGFAMDLGSILEVVCMASCHGRCHCCYSWLSPRKPGAYDVR